MTEKGTVLKTNMDIKYAPFAIGNTSSNGGFSIAVLVFGAGKTEPFGYGTVPPQNRLKMDSLQEN